MEPEVDLGYANRHLCVVHFSKPPSEQTILFLVHFRSDLQPTLLQHIYNERMPTTRNSRRPPLLR